MYGLIVTPPESLGLRSRVREMGAQWLFLAPGTQTSHKGFQLISAEPLPAAQRAMNSMCDNLKQVKTELWSHRRQSHEVRIPLCCICAVMRIVSLDPLTPNCQGAGRYGADIPSFGVKPASNLIPVFDREPALMAYHAMLQTKTRTLLTRPLASPYEWENHIERLVCFSLQGELVLAITYGYEVKERHDPTLDAARQ
ncbi:hypothetical protein EDB85DRAFT_1887246 [Lactarius pseudohatsudake]|nr:hypothetical protein EDB85DRAFT_1887246 [Lactarius pseudohatsudake]